MTVEEFAKLLIKELHQNSLGVYVNDNDLTFVCLDGRFDMIKVAKAIANQLDVSLSG